MLCEPGSPADAALTDWAVEATTDLMVRPAQPGDDAGLLEPVGTWAPAWAAIRGVGDAHRRALEDRLSGLADVTGAVARDGDTPLAVGLAIRTGRLVGIFNVATAPDARRRGHGASITHALMDWGARGGASHAYLQVEVGNRAATALYEGLGFATAARYHYRLG